MISVATTRSDVGAEELLAHDAAAVGSLIAELGCDLLTGGGPGAMKIVARSFCLAPFRVGRSVGVLPGRAKGLDRQVLGQVDPLSLATKPPGANSWIEIPIRTHLSGDEPKGADSRNFINVASGAALVVLAGGAGTQAELELALALGTPTFVLLRTGQKLGQYVVGTIPDRATVVESIGALKTALLAIIAPTSLSRPAFSSLRSNYKTGATQIHQCSMHFPNTCAIRMSEALEKAVPGIVDKFRLSAVNLCPHDYVRGAQDLAGVLRRADVFGVYDAGFTQPNSAPPELAGKTGIVAYMKIPDFDGQGHIDLWDGSAPVGSAYWSAETVWFWKLG